MAEPTDNSRLIRSPLNQMAPDFEARTTLGLVRLSDYRGKWLLFFSHPADFTPVCTSEFVSLQKAQNKFSALNCDLLGLSVDSVFSHIAWLRDIENNFDTKITFPIIEDTSMAIGRAHGMIHQESESTAAVRSVFFIDPEGVIRAQIHYPMVVGRSVDELLRVLAALQHADGHGVGTPEGWRPGDKAVLPPPLNDDEASQREQHSSSTAWYFTSKELEND